MLIHTCQLKPLEELQIQFRVEYLEEYLDQEVGGAESENCVALSYKGIADICICGGSGNGQLYNSSLGKTLEGINLPITKKEIIETNSSFFLWERNWIHTQEYTYLLRYFDYDPTANQLFLACGGGHSLNKKSNYNCFIYDLKNHSYFCPTTKLCKLESLISQI